MNILERIVEQTTEDLSRRKQKVSLKDLESFECFERNIQDFAGTLKNSDQVSIIAEVKKASPSKGVIRENFDPVDIALRYQEGGASAISVLTDEPFFKGKLEYLESVSKRVNIPVLRKDFIIDPYQIKEARAFGADAVLIIVSITEGNQLDELLHAAKEFGLDALVECYDEDDFNRINFNMVNLLGVNNRDLNTFEVNVHRGISILQMAPEDTILVSESGISNPDDLAILRKEGIHSALIGEYFMSKLDPGKALKELMKQAEEYYLKDYK